MPLKSPGQGGRFIIDGMIHQSRRPWPAHFTPNQRLSRCPLQPATPTGQPGKSGESARLFAAAGGMGV